MTLMKRSLAALAALLLAAPAYKLILDYDVPESPAFVALGVSPEKVLTGSASKPVVVNLLQQVVSGGNTQAGLALDFAPYFVFGGRFANIQEYRDNPIKRRLANTTVSLATIQDPADSASLRYGLGVRVTLLDDHDPLQSSAMTQAIEQLLIPPADDGRPGRRRSTGIDTVAGLEAAYANALANIRSQPGRAIAIGWGMSGTVRSSVFSADSITGTRHRFWLGYRERFAREIDFLGVLLVGGSAEDGSETSFRVGGALRSNLQGVQLTGELVYESETEEFHPGALAIVKLIPQLDLVASLGTQPDPADDTGRLRFRTMVRWNMSQGANARP
jgi:hypothetical protein